MRRLWTLGIGSVIGATMLFSAQPASAGINTHHVTARGSAWFAHYGDVVKACDRRRDGWGVRAEAHAHNGGTFSVTDKFGHGCRSVSAWRFFREGVIVELHVCLYKPGRTPRCSGAGVGRA
jgi:hypothetical protein